MNQILDLYKGPDASQRTATSETTDAARTTDTESTKTSVRSACLAEHPDWAEVLQWGCCEKHGEYPIVVRTVDGATVTPFGGECPKCKAEKKQTAIMGRLAIPPRFRDCTVKSFHATNPEQQRARASVIEFCKDIRAHIEHGDWVVMAGNSGTGKTHLACAIAKVASAAGYSVLFTRVRPMIKRIRRTWRPGSVETEEEVIRKFTDLDLLILDEVGVQTGTDKEHLEFFDVLAERYENMKATILLSNFPFSVSQEDRKRGVRGLEDYLGSKVYDRCFEDGSIVIPFTWESHRGRGAK